MLNGKKSWFCYLPVTPSMREWGLFVLDAGYTMIPVDSPYPPAQHPDDHHFSWEKGRTLNSYTMVYITTGCGIFESAGGGEQPIEAGDVFILFPGVWHRYHPDPQSGWTEHWVEFDGEQARHIMENLGFSAKKPVVAVGNDVELLELFIAISEATETQPFGFEYVIASQTSQIIARTLVHLLRNESHSPAFDGLIQQARLQIMEKAESAIDFKDMAARMGLGYSVFRRRFREMTGLPPGQYQIQIRINKAQELLRRSDLSIGDIATRLGFESVYYFSRLFKTKTGRSPRAYRNQRDA